MVRKCSMSVYCNYKCKNFPKLCFCFEYTTLKCSLEVGYRTYDKL